MIGALRGSVPRLPVKAALVIQPQGEIVEQLSGEPLERALQRAPGGGRPQTLLWDLIDCVRAAKTDTRIPVIVLDFRKFGGAGQPVLEELARSLRASRWQTFWKVQFPAALPFIFSGAKVAVTLAVIGAVIGEFVGSINGLGNLLLSANSQLDGPLAWAALVWLSVLGIVLFLGVVLAERILMPWAGSGHH